MHGSHHITFTRDPLRTKKMISVSVEQKNYSVVRQAIGYARMDTDEQLACLVELDRPLNRFTNFFQPSVELKDEDPLWSQGQ